MAARNPVTCPICLNSVGGGCTERKYGGNAILDCDICGEFELTGSAKVTLERSLSEMSTLQRAAISHRLRQAIGNGQDRSIVNTDWLESFVGSGARPPTPSAQAINMLRFIGEEITKTGRNLESLPLHFYATIGAPSPELAHQIASELIKQGLLVGRDISTDDGPDIMNVGMTLRGWERYEAERRGKESAGYGFLALRFGDQKLDVFVRDVLKPCIRQALRFEVVDMRDVARAGIIDNIMRAQIRDATFVIVDLTHDNSGAYWEAGYAEGLGKPVIYICERSKFESVRTHFDTNHCTTVMWSADDGEDFNRDIIATLRRSLNLF